MGSSKAYPGYTFYRYRKLWISLGALVCFILGRWSSNLTTITLNSEGITGLLSIDELCENQMREDVPDHFNFFQYRVKDWEKNVLPFVEQKIKTQGTINVLEIGVCAGTSTKWIFKNMIEPYPGSKYVGIDYFLPQHRGYFCSNLGDVPLSHVPLMKKGFSLPALVELTADVYKMRDERSQRFGNPYLFDFIYVDGGHSSTEVFNDITFAWALLKKGGLMVLDDYDIIDYWTPTSPKLIIDPFVTGYKDFIANHWLYANQMYLIKAEDAIMGNALFKNETF